MNHSKRRFKAIIIEKNTIIKSASGLLTLVVAFSSFKYIGKSFSLHPEQIYRFAGYSVESILPHANSDNTFEKFGFIRQAAVKASGLELFIEKRTSSLNTDPYFTAPVSLYTPLSEDDFKQNTQTNTPIDTSNIKEKEINTSYGFVSIDNKTNFNIDTNALLTAPLSLKNTPGEPLVLIVHTHTTESYTPTEAYNYTPQSNWRTTDENFNMIRVGNKFAEGLSNAGINVIHDKSINDYPSYNGSYTKTLGVINSYLEKYPSIQIVIDIHRDSMTASDGTRYKVSTDIDGKKTAQIMIVMGSSEGGLSHPNWQENLKLGLKLQSRLNTSYNNIARPLSIRKERFNTHATKGSMIIEIGTDANTMDEALLCAEYSSKVFADVINSEIK